MDRLTPDIIELSLQSCRYGYQTATDLIPGNAAGFGWSFPQGIPGWEKERERMKALKFRV